VEIEVVRIGDSALAPAFKLVAQPNDWGKQVRTATAAAAGEVSERGRLYWEFWEQVRIRIQADHPGWSRARTSTTASWYNTALGTSGVVLSMAFTRSGLVCQIYFDAPDAHLNAARFEALHEQRSEFDAVLGEPATWDVMAGRKAAKISVQSSFADVADRESWPLMISWLIETQARLRAALDAIGGVPSA
jgi:hypothetical protein